MGLSSGLVQDGPVSEGFPITVHESSQFMYEALYKQQESVIIPSKLELFTNDLPSGILTNKLLNLLIIVPLCVLSVSGSDPVTSWQAEIRMKVAWCS